MSDAADFCGDLAPILRIVGIVYFAIEVIVPILLIITGMLDMAKAVTEKKEDKIKEAQNLLIKRAIAAVIVFFVTFIVGVVMKLVGHDEYKECTTCITNVWGKDCKALVNSAEE